MTEGSLESYGLSEGVTVGLALRCVASLFSVLVAA